MEIQEKITFNYPEVEYKTDEFIYSPAARIVNEFLDHHVFRVHKNGAVTTDVDRARRVCERQYRRTDDYPDLDQAEVTKLEGWVEKGLTAVFTTFTKEEIIPPEVKEEVKSRFYNAQITYKDYHEYKALKGERVHLEFGAYQFIEIKDFLEDTLGRFGIEVSPYKLVGLTTIVGVGHEAGHAATESIARLRAYEMKREKPNERLSKLKARALEQIYSGVLAIAPHPLLQRILDPESKEFKLKHAQETSIERVAMGFEMLALRVGLNTLGIEPSTTQQILESIRERYNNNLAEQMKVISKARAMGISFDALGRGIRRIQRVLETSQDPNTQILSNLIPDQYGTVYIGYDAPLREEELKQAMRRYLPRSLKLKAA